MEILSKDYWFKVVEMLQQNWALIEPSQSGKSCVGYFIGGTSDVFDQFEFAEIAEAEKQLRINRFAKYEDDEKAKKFIVPRHRHFTSRATRMERFTHRVNSGKQNEF